MDACEWLLIAMGILNVAVPWGANFRVVVYWDHFGSPTRTVYPFASLLTTVIGSHASALMLAPKPWLSFGYRSWPSIVNRGPLGTVLVGEDAGLFAATAELLWAWLDDELGPQALTAQAIATATVPTMPSFIRIPPNLSVMLDVVAS